MITAACTSQRVPENSSIALKATAASVSNHRARKITKHTAGAGFTFWSRSDLQTGARRERPSKSYFMIPSRDHCCVPVSSVTQCWHAHVHGGSSRQPWVSFTPGPCARRISLSCSTHRRPCSTSRSAAMAAVGTAVDLDEALDVAKRAAATAGTLIRSAFSEQKTVEHKGKASRCLFPQTDVRLLFSNSSVQLQNEMLMTRRPPCSAVIRGPPAAN